MENHNVSVFTIADAIEDAVCGFYVALLANAAGEAVLYAGTRDGDVVSKQTRCPDELCTWLEGAAGEHGDAYGSLRTSEGEVVGVHRVSPRGTELVRPVPPSIELVTRSDRLVEIWLFDSVASHDHPILQELQALLDPEVEGDECVPVPIPGVPGAETALLIPADPDELYGKAIPYYAPDELAEAFGVTVEPPGGGTHGSWRRRGGGAGGRRAVAPRRRRDPRPDRLRPPELAPGRVRAGRAGPADGKGRLAEP